MLIPVVCHTCGRPIGDKYELFRHMREKLVKKILQERGTDSTQAAVDVGLQIDCSEILTKLRIDEPCCRTRMTTGMVYSDYY